MFKKTLILFAAAAAAAFAAENDAVKRLDEATTALNDIMAAPDKGIPLDLFHKSQCIIIIPGMKKAGFIVAAKYGRGYASCRVGTGWSAPAGMRLEGGSFGLQVGAAGTDIVMLVMNKSGVEKLLKSKFTLGGDATATAGPVGRDASAQTDAMMTAEILTWSRSKGLFGGVSLTGSTMRPDEDADNELYGKDKAKTPEILTGKVKPTAPEKPFLAAVSKYGGTAKK
jgi:SH3 domain-containing YSC84-like protein 1